MTSPAAEAKSIVCPSCGFKNAPPPANGRCISCGSTMESLTRARTREEELERRYQQEGFSLQWMLIAIVVQAVLTGALVIGLPMVIPALDFEGGNGMLVTIPVWFVGGLLVGLISPGKTFTEPVVASFFVAMPTVFYLVRSETVRTLPTFMYIIMGIIGVLFTLIGSYIGERIQMGPPPRKVELGFCPRERQPSSHDTIAAMTQVSRRFFLVGTTAAAALLATSARADDVDDALAEIAKARESVKTLIAPLSQDRTLGLMATMVSSHGMLTVVRPDRLRWELKPPDEAIYWVGPEGIAYRTPHGSGKVGIGNAGTLGAVLDDLLIVLGGDLTLLKARHTLTTRKLSGGAISLTMTPKSEKVAKIVKQLTVEFTSELTAARTIAMDEGGGDSTLITFDTPKINEPVDPAKMRP